jgi:hypothetical protein
MRGQIRDRVETALHDKAVDQLFGRGLDRLLELGNRLRRQRRADHSAQQVMLRRIARQKVAPCDRVGALVRGHALGGREDCMIEQRLPHVGVPTDRPQAVLR